MEPNQRMHSEARRQAKSWLEGLSDGEREALSTHSQTALRTMLAWSMLRALDSQERTSGAATDSDEEVGPTR